MEPLLSEKNILITGGTSRLGEAFVRQAARQGAHVFFTYHQNREKAEGLSKIRARAYAVDLSEDPSIRKFLDEFKKTVKHLDVLIHNAAAVADNRIENMEEAEWDRVMKVNLKAPFYLTQQLLPLLSVRKPGKVFMLTSRTALMGCIGASNYAAAKAGMIGLVKSWAMELGSEKILVNAVNPGFMLSGMTEPLPEWVKAEHRRQSVLGEFSNPEEVAEFMAYLCSDKMTQVSGQIFHFESRKIH